MRMADHGLYMQTEGTVVAVRSVETEGRHTQHDETGVYPMQGLPTDAGFVHGLGGIVFNQHVAMPHEA